MVVGILFTLVLLYRSSKAGSELAAWSLRIPSHKRGSIVVLPAADPKGPPQMCGSLTLARPCVAVALRSGPGAVQQHASQRHRVTFFLKKEVAEIVFQNAAIGIVDFFHDEALFPYCGLAHFLKRVLISAITPPTYHFFFEFYVQDRSTPTPTTIPGTYYSSLNYSTL